MHKKRGGPRKSAALFLQIVQNDKTITARSDLFDSDGEIGGILLEADLSRCGAQSVDERSQTQSTHGLVQEGHIASVSAVQPSLQGTVRAEQLEAVVAAPVTTEHGAQSCVDNTLLEAVADQSDDIGGELLHVSSSPSVGQVVSHGAAVDDLCIDSREVCRHHHNELLPSNEKNEYDRSPPGCATGKTYVTECALGNITS